MHDIACGLLRGMTDSRSRRTCHMIYAHALMCIFVFCSPFYLHGLTLIQTWINNYIHYDVWDEIAYPFINFNGRTVEF